MLQPSEPRDLAMRARSTVLLIHRRWCSTWACTSCSFRSTRACRGAFLAILRAARHIALKCRVCQAEGTIVSRGEASRVAVGEIVDALAHIRLYAAEGEGEGGGTSR